MTYPAWVRNPILEMYSQGLNLHQVEALTGISYMSVWRWCKTAGIMRSYSEGQKGRRHSAETRQKISAATKGELHPNWKGGDEYGAQHRQARKDFPDPLGLCELCGERDAIHRARMDHTTLPYDSGLVVLACQSCNRKHDDGTISITFLHDGRLLCAVKKNRKEPHLLEVS